jgi:hypothetical protein
MKLRTIWIPPVLLLLPAALVSCWQSSPPVVDEPVPRVDEPEPIAKEPSPVMENSTLLGKEKGKETMNTKHLLELVGRLRGTADHNGNGILVEGKHAYLLGTTLVQREDGDYQLAGILQVLDVSDPTTPSVVETGDLPRGVVKLGGKYAYVAAGKELCVLDVSNPKAPKVMGFCEMRDTEPSKGGVAVAGNYAYVADSEGASAAMLVVDISNPEAPRGVESCEETEEFNANNVVVSGDYLYVCGRGDALLSVFRIAR